MLAIDPRPEKSIATPELVRYAELHEPMVDHRGSFQSVAKSISQLDERAFYGHIAGQLKRCATDKVSTAAVTFDSSGDIELLVNPSFFIDELNVDERVAVIKHELLHVVLKHLSRLDWRNTIRSF